VLLFGKVLRHEVDEEFRYVQLTIKSSVQQLLKQALREKYPTKASAEVNRILTMITNGKILMEQAIWQKIIRHMYEAEDVEILSSNLRLINSVKPLKTPKSSFNFATEKRADSKKSRDPKSKKRGRTNSFQATQVVSHKINFTDFLEIILDF